MSNWRIPFNKPSISAIERSLIVEALDCGQIHGDGPYTRSAEAAIRDLTGTGHVLLTSSGTGALELSALLLDAEPGQEVIMPSWTFSSTANAFCLRGLVPVFVDVTPDTLTLDIAAVRAACNERTCAIVVVNYGGFGPDMAAFVALAREKNIALIEDAAQAAGARRDGRHYGTFGSMGCLSFHGTKNIVSGEGGALMLANDELIDRAEVLREKGTDRSRFLRGETDKYTWRDLGSSYLPPEPAAALLTAQLRRESEINGARRRIWARYQSAMAPLAASGRIRLAQPSVADSGNGHIFWMICDSPAARDALRRHLGERGIQTATHYVPLHDSPAGVRFGRSSGAYPVTQMAADRLLRLPMWADLTAAQVDEVVDAVLGYFAGAGASIVRQGATAS